MLTKVSFIRILAVAVVVSLVSFQSTAGWSAGKIDQTVLRIEVSVEKGEQVKVSVPLNVLDSLFDALPSELQEVCEELDLGPQEIQKEFLALDGEDLVQITGKENIRIWFETVNEDEAKALKFITVYVHERGEDGQEIHVNVPKGLVKMSSRVIKKLGLADDLIQLPKEVREKISMLRAEQ